MSTVSNNILSFPVNDNLPYTPPKTREQIRENIDLIRQIHVQEALEIVMELMFTHLQLAGFNIDDENTPSQREGAFIAESIRSVLLNIYGIDHPFQKICDNIFVERKDGSLDIAKEIALVLKEDSPEPELELELENEE